MKFRVTSVAGDDTGPRLNWILVKLEDWLNASIGDGVFGEGVDQIVFALISVCDDPDQNAAWAKPYDKTESFTNQFNRAEKVRYISFAVSVPPTSVLEKSPLALLSFVSTAMIARVMVRPKRVPKGFEYARFAAGVAKALEVFVEMS